MRKNFPNFSSHFMLVKLPGSTNFNFNENKLHSASILINTKFFRLARDVVGEAFELISQRM